MDNIVSLIAAAARPLFEARRFSQAAKLLEVAYDVATDDNARDNICANIRMCWFLANDVSRAFEWLQQQESLGIDTSWELARDKANYLRYLDRHDEALAIVQTLSDETTRNLAVSWFEHKQGLTRQAFSTTELSRTDRYWWDSDPPYPHKIWQGQRVKNLVVVSESGAGDEIIFARWIPQIKALAENVWYDGPWSLGEVFTRNFDIQYLDRRYPPHDCAVVPIMSLAQRLDVDHPDGRAYLRSDQRRKDHYIKQYPCEQKHRIGICCDGWIMHAENNLRAIPQAELVSALQDIGEIVNLQMVYDQQDPRVRYVPFESWEDTMALIDTCDVVVSCDTSVAHAAAALGRPTVVLMHHAAYFTWNHHQDLGQTAWYPDAWCVHQNIPCDWTHPISKCSTLVQRLLNRNLT